MLKEIKQNIILQGISWFLVEVPLVIVGAVENFLLFNIRFFSIPLLLKTLFSPWRRYSWSYKGEVNLLRYLEVFVGNTFSRAIGILMRIFLIIFGIISEVFIFIAGMIIFLGWFLLPLLIISGVFFGLRQVLM